MVHSWFCLLSIIYYIKNNYTLNLWILQDAKFPKAMLLASEISVLTIPRYPHHPHIRPYLKLVLCRVRHQANKSPHAALCLSHSLACPLRVPLGRFVFSRDCMSGESKRTRPVPIQTMTFLFTSSTFRSFGA